MPRQAEIDKGLRVRLAPQGITGTSYLEIDYVDPKANPAAADIVGRPTISTFRARGRR